VAAGLGVAVVPRLAQDAPPPGVVIRPLLGEPAARHLFIACRRGAEDHPAVRAVIDALREVVSSTAQTAFARSTTP
jgi:DNA-binding transcriptional LysR family regulator